MMYENNHCNLQIIKKVFNLLNSLLCRVKGEGLKIQRKLTWSVIQDNYLVLIWVQLRGGGGYGFKTYLGGGPLKIKLTLEQSQSLADSINWVTIAIEKWK